MLVHLNAKDTKPNRVVIIGANGFVGGSILEKLTEKGIETCALTREHVDLLAEGAGKELSNLLRKDDHVVMASAVAPVKDVNMLQQNIRIIGSLAEAISRRPVSFILNISSDAIYSDSNEPLSEISCSSPSSLHGVMHLCREIMLRDACKDTPFCSLRPTLIYGVNDPHNGYGPNQFRRLAEQGQDIVLFGNGEELRDHVYVGDVAELASRILARSSTGTLNAATGQVISFDECAKELISIYKSNSKILNQPRQMPMPHNGYRAFDTTATKLSFPDFHYTSPKDGFLIVSGHQ